MLGDAYAHCTTSYSCLENLRETEFRRNGLICSVEEILRHSGPAIELAHCFNGGGRRERAGGRVRGRERKGGDGREGKRRGDKL